MNVEMEVIENVYYSEPKLLRWVCDLIRTLGRDDPFTVLGGMWEGEFIIFRNADGDRLPDWKIAEILRNQDSWAEAYIEGTKKGAAWLEGEER